MLSVLNSSYTEGSTTDGCPIKDATVKDELDISNGTVDTAESSDGVMTGPIVPPIVVCEDDGVGGDDVVIGQGGTKQINWHTCLLKDSLEVQKHHSPNDTEVHEETPHLRDYLIPHKEVHVDRPEEADKAAGEEITTQDEGSAEDKIVPKIECRGILQTKADDVHVPEEEIPKRKVQFSTVVVRDYDMILGDHPCCSYGPPVTIDWDYLEYEPLDVNEYEFHHGPRRGLRQMCMNYYQRKRLLANAGYTDVEIKQMKREVSRTKINRSITKQVVGYKGHIVEDAVESAKRKFKRLIKKDHWKADKGMDKTIHRSCHSITSITTE